MYQLPTQYQEFMHLSRYARWDESAGRRERWGETVDRYFNFFVPHLTEHHGLSIKHSELDFLRDSVGNLSTMPSMRCLMTAGPALARDHVAGYNCAYTSIDSPRAFDEILFILMCGTGVGFSVERQFIRKMPEVPEKFETSGTVIIVRDSKRGWAEAFKELIAMLYAGRVPSWDTSRVRPKGARLVTMGGRSSGPAPLDDLFNFTIRVFETAQGRRLRSIECHDIACQIGRCVVVGGVRRSAMISLSNLSDQRMRDAKSGNFGEVAPWRYVSNNSVAYTEQPDVGQFMSEWMSLYNSKSGERGIFNREAARNQAMRSGRRRGYWDDGQTQPIDFGTNPCSEIILRSQQFCNLSEIVCRPDDSFETLMKKAEAAAILGTWQSSLTDFRYLRKKWKNNCEEERLLGVSMTGIMDCPLTNGSQPRSQTADMLESIKRHVNDVNDEWAHRLSIPPSAAATCVKPSGTASQLVMSGSGIHAWHAPHYVRRVQQDVKDPITRLMKDAGIPWEPQHDNPEGAVVFSFPTRAPEGAVCRDDRDAIQELEHWKLYQDHWCEHKPSVTITVRENEWPAVGAWVWERFDQMSGVSFLPHSEHGYTQAPYEAVQEDRLIELEDQMPDNIDWSVLGEYERDDEFVTATKELACTGGSCEI